MRRGHSFHKTKSLKVNSTITRGTLISNSIEPGLNSVSPRTKSGLTFLNKRRLKHGDAIRLNSLNGRQSSLLHPHYNGKQAWKCMRVWNLHKVSVIKKKVSNFRMHDGRVLLLVRLCMLLVVMPFIIQLLTYSSPVRRDKWSRWLWEDGTPSPPSCGLSRRPGRARASRTRFGKVLWPRLCEVYL